MREYIDTVSFDKYKEIKMVFICSLIHKANFVLQNSIISLARL